MKAWAKELYKFYTDLKPPVDLPDGIHWLYPQKQKSVQTILKLFLERYYSDNRKRRLILGINPGRFGAGITGINLRHPGS